MENTTRQYIPISRLPDTRGLRAERTTHYNYNKVALTVFDTFEETTLRYYNFSKPTLAVMLQGYKQLIFESTTLSFGGAGIIAISPDVPVWVNIKGASADNPVRCMILTVDEEYVKSQLEQHVQHREDIVPTQFLEGDFWYFNDCGLFEVMQRFLNLSLENNTQKEQLVHLALTELILRLGQTRLRYSFLDKQNTQVSKDAFEHVLEYIDANFTDQISIETLCTIAHTSKSVLFRKFKAVFNTTPIDFILRKKVDRAKEMLLKHEHLPIKGICMECGFNSESYFSYIFKRYTGNNPQAYRRFNYSQLNP